MEITVLGASGGTGKQVVDQAVAAGHRVTAVVRNPARLTVPAGFDVVTADVMKVEELRPAVRGRDAVVVALGTGAQPSSPVLTPAVEALISAMWAENVSRVLLVSNSGMYTEGDPFFLRAVLKPIVRRVLRHHWADAFRAEETLRSTGLDWTVARPPRLTDGPHTGRYRTSETANVRGGTTISRADLADLLLRAVVDDATIHQAISIGY